MYRESCIGLAHQPFLMALTLISDGTDVMSGSPQRHRLQLNVTEVGSERPVNGHQAAQSQCLTLHGPHVMPRHCVVAHTEGIVTVTPCSRDAETYVNGVRIYETTILQVEYLAFLTYELCLCVVDIVIFSFFLLEWSDSEIWEATQLPVH